MLEQVPQEKVKVQKEQVKVRKEQAKVPKASLERRTSGSVSWGSCNPARRGSAPRPTFGRPRQGTVHRSGRLDR